MTEPSPRELAVILHADVVGSTGLVQRNESLAHERIQDTFHRFSATIESYGGITHELRGDALLAEFHRASDAVSASLAFQAENTGFNRTLADDIQPRLRIGISLGEVVIADHTLTGEGVVLAQRLEQLAEPGGLCIQGAVHEAVPGRLPFEYENLGEQALKGFDELVWAFAVTMVPGEAIPSPEPRPRVWPGDRRFTRRWPQSVAVVGVLLAVVAGGLLMWWQMTRPEFEPASTQRMAFPLPDKPSIAVLPFTSMSAESEDEYFADGITDDLITDLSKISGLFVIARNSVFTYKDTAVKVQQVAEELGVRYVLEGSVRRAGGRVRINAQLIDAGTGHHLWAERYDRDYTDIFSLQDEVIEKIVGAMAVRLTSAEQKNLKRIPTTNLEAYDYYLRAEQQGYGSINTVNVALGLYEKAIKLDANFAEAYAGYARTAVDIWRLNYDNFLSNPVARKLTYEAASRALDLEPALPRAYSVLGFLQMVDGAYEEAIASGRRAVKLGPSSADANLNLSMILTYVGETGEAVKAVLAAQRLDPELSPRNMAEAGFVYFMDRQPETAVELIEKARNSMPDNERLNEYLSVAYAKAGRMTEARSEMGKLLATYPFYSLSQYRLYYGYYAREQDLAYYLSALKEAGLPEWPFGFEGRLEDRLNAAEVRELSFGRGWIGTVNRAQRFFQEIAENGAYAYRTGTSFITGEASMEGDMLCLQTEISRLGVRQCGYLYRNPDGGPETRDEYISVHPSFLSTFSVRR